MYTYAVHIFYIPQNENVGRDATSTYLTVDLRRPERRTPMRALVAKSFHFADRVWMAYLHSMPDFGMCINLESIQLFNIVTF